MTVFDQTVVSAAKKYEAEKSVLTRMIADLKSQLESLSPPPMHFIGHVQFSNLETFQAALPNVRFVAHDNQEFKSGYTHILKCTDECEEMIDVYFTYLFHNQQYLTTKIYAAILSKFHKGTIIINDPQAFDWFFNDDEYEWQYEDGSIWRFIETADIYNNNNFTKNIRRVRRSPKPFKPETNPPQTTTLPSPVKTNPTATSTPMPGSTRTNNTSMQCEPSPIAIGSTPNSPHNPLEPRWQYNNNGRWINFPTSVHNYFQDFLKQGSTTQVLYVMLNGQQCIADFAKSKFLNMYNNKYYDMRYVK